MTNFERWCEMAVDAQNTPHVIGEMRKPEGIDSFDSEAGTSVKSPEPYLLLDQMTIGRGNNLDRPTDCRVLHLVRVAHCIRVHHAPAL